MDSKGLELLFSSGKGKSIYTDALRAIDEYSMRDAIKKGVVIGLSGGADSVMLILLLLEYRRREGNFPITALHVNHGIRGSEAERDEEFSRSLCKRLGVEFRSVKIDVPKIAADEKIGIEEAARNVRYQEFSKIISSRNDISSIAVAHNATDNLETVVLNILRGASLKGVCGIPPHRDNIIRPLIYVSKEQITEALSDAKIDFVTDSTNFCSDYTRNYIRNEILPMLAHVTAHPEAATTRLSVSLRRDFDYIDSEARRFLALNCRECGIPISSLSALHTSVFSRVLTLIASDTGVSVEYTHIEKTIALIQNGGTFSLDLPGGAAFLSDGAYFRMKTEDDLEDSMLFETELSLGENLLQGGKAAILISRDKNEIFSSNVYKISIQESFKFDIINRQLVARAKRDGDEYRARAMTRSIRKLYTDRKLAEKKRKTLPIILSGDRIIWVPGFDVADDARPTSGEELIYITYAEADT